MLIGIILLLAGLTFFVVGFLLPRVHQGILPYLETIPKEMHGMVAQMVPQFGKILKLLDLLPKLGKIGLILGGILAMLGIYTFTLPSTPLWLAILGWVALISLLVMGVGLAVLAKRFLPQAQGMGNSMQEMQQMASLFSGKEPPRPKQKQKQKR